MGYDDGPLLRMGFVELVEVAECHRVRVRVLNLRKSDADALVRGLLGKVIGEVVDVGVDLDALR